MPDRRAFWTFLVFGVHLPACGGDKTCPMPSYTASENGELAYVGSEPDDPDATRAEGTLADNGYVDFQPTNVELGFYTRFANRAVELHLDFTPPTRTGTFRLEDQNAVFCEVPTLATDERERCIAITGELVVTTLAPTCGGGACAQFEADLSVTLRALDSGPAVSGAVHVSYKETMVDEPCGGGGGCGGRLIGLGDM